MWLKRIYEELGWMVLAKQMGYKDKIRGYKMQIRRFNEALENMKKELQDPDHLRDLEVLEEKMAVLEKHVHKDFD